MSRGDFASRRLGSKICHGSYFDFLNSSGRPPCFLLPSNHGSLKPIAVEGFLVVATRVRLNEFNHQELACDIARDFRIAYREVEALYGRGATRRIPVFGVGHSLGAKVHMLLNCYEDVVEVAKRRKVRQEWSFPPKHASTSQRKPLVDRHIGANGLWLTTSGL